MIESKQSGLGQTRDWPCGDIVADPPETGKTAMAITFCLISTKLGFLNLPTYIFVKTTIASQYVNEILCFVNVGAGMERGMPLLPEWAPTLRRFRAALLLSLNCAAVQETMY